MKKMRMAEPPFFSLSLSLSLSFLPFPRRKLTSDAFPVFVVDEISDDQNGKDARATGQIFLDAMNHPEREDNAVLARMTKEYAPFLSPLFLHSNKPPHPFPPLPSKKNSALASFGEQNRAV
jgi:hypothetical protein